MVVSQFETETLPHLFPRPLPASPSGAVSNPLPIPTKPCFGSNFGTMLRPFFNPKWFVSCTKSTKVLMATNQKVGSSNLSGRAIPFTRLPRNSQPQVWDDWVQHRNSIQLCLPLDADIQALHACVNTCPLFAKRNAESTASASR